MEVPETGNIADDNTVRGRIFQFKPRQQWSDDSQREVPEDHLYQIHPVVVLRIQPKGRVQIANITSTLKPTVDHRMYVPISAPHWNISGDRPRLSLAGTSQKTIELPKPHSYVKLDSRREVPFEILKEFTHDGSPYQLTKASMAMLWNFVLQAEQGSSIEVSHYWEVQNKVNAAIKKAKKEKKAKKRKEEAKNGKEVKKPKKVKKTKKEKKAKKRKEEAKNGKEVKKPKKVKKAKKEKKAKKRKEGPKNGKEVKKPLKVKKAKKLRAE